MKLPKILTEKEKHEKERKRKGWMTVFIVFVLLASTAAFALTSNNPSEKAKYKEFTFTKTESGWQLKNSNLITSFLPTEVENISSPAISTEDFRKNVYFLAITNPEQMAANEINRAFYNVITKAQLACSEKYENETFCKELPIKSCENETSASNLIVQIEDSENQSMEYNNNCVIIKGNEADLLKSVDRLIYAAYGIIK